MGKIIFQFHYKFSVPTFKKKKSGKEKKHEQVIEISLTSHNIAAN